MMKRGIKRRKRRIEQGRSRRKRWKRRKDVNEEVERFLREIG